MNLIAFAMMNKVDQPFDCFAFLKVTKWCQKLVRLVIPLSVRLQHTRSVVVLLRLHPNTVYLGFVTSLRCCTRAWQPSKPFRQLAAGRKSSAAVFLPSNNELSRCFGEIGHYFHLLNHIIFAHSERDADACLGRSSTVRDSDHDFPSILSSRCE